MITRVEEQYLMELGFTLGEIADVGGFKNRLENDYAIYSAREVMVDDREVSTGGGFVEGECVNCGGTVRDGQCSVCG